jgi:hypothetical protein
VLGDFWVVFDFPRLVWLKSVTSASVVTHDTFVK